MHRHFPCALEYELFPCLLFACTPPPPHLAPFLPSQIPGSSATFCRERSGNDVGLGVTEQFQGPGLGAYKIVIGAPTTTTVPTPPPHLLHGVYPLIGPLPETEAKQGREECMAKGHSDKLASGLGGGGDGNGEGVGVVCRDRSGERQNNTHRQMFSLSFWVGGKPRFMT